MSSCFVRPALVEVKGKVVRLGIEAPKEVPVHRSELHERIRKREWRPSSGVSTKDFQLRCRQILL
jgi:carbon storage regulator CsrA